MVVVDRFTKIAHFVACHKADDASYITDLYLWEIIRLYGVPKTIVSDKDTQFLSYFRRSLWHLLGTKLLYSTTCHPQTDGQTEVTNRALSTHLRTMVQKNLKYWDIKLPHAEFACNRTPVRAIGCSPFEVLNRIHPLLLLILFLDLLTVRSVLRMNRGLKKWRGFINRSGHILRKSMKLTRLRPTEIGRPWSFNLGTLFGYTSGRRGFPPGGRVS